MSNQIETIKHSRSPHKQITDSDKLPAILRQMAGLNKEGTSKLFTPAQLYEGAMNYFKSVSVNPIISKQIITGGQKAGDIVPVDKPRMPTLKGMCLFLGVNSNYLNHLVDQIEGKEDELSKQYSIILMCIKDTIEVNWFENAAVREYDAMFIAKLSGLTDKVEHSGKIENMVTSITFTEKVIYDTEFEDVKEILDTE